MSGTTDQKQTLYSAVQPSGTITLGNYLGAIRNFVTLESQFDCLFCMADLHSLTVRQEPASLRRRTVELAALYMACGLSPEKSVIYCQSHVSAHAELAWILGCFTYMGELSRMTQFKDKSAKHADNINAGLFTYPVLMAADILLYQTKVVPMGMDQKQHLEIARDIAIRFNNLYGDVFTVPEPFIRKDTAKIMSLSEPEKKMSKSDLPDSYIAVLDTPDDIRRKLKRAVTDSDGEIRIDAENKPGVTNLLTILSVLTEKTPEAVALEMSGLGYGALKTRTADAVVAALEPIQQRFNDLMKDKEEIARILKGGAEKASCLAHKTLRKVYKKVGLYQP